MQQLIWDFYSEDHCTKRFIKCVGRLTQKETQPTKIHLIKRENISAITMNYESIIVSLIGGSEIEMIGNNTNDGLKSYNDFLKAMNE